MPKPKDENKYSEKEAQERLDKTLKAALNFYPKKQKPEKQKPNKSGSTKK